MRDHPDSAGRLGVSVLPLQQQLTGDVRRPLIMLQSAAALVLLICCSNVANLFLSRATTRRREIAMRTSLGASRATIVRQLLIESVLVAGAGGVLGLLLARWSFAFLQQLIPSAMTLSTPLQLNAGMLAFASMTCLLVGVAIGLAPALQASKVDLSEATKADGGHTNLVKQARLRSTMVVAQVALAVVVLALIWPLNVVVPPVLALIPTALFALLVLVIVPLYVTPAVPPLMTGFLKC